MAVEFTAPSFVQESDAQIIQQRMMNMLPADIDNMPGGFPWDFTMPTAMEKAELIQFHLVQTLQLMFPMWAWGEWLDYHAAAAGITRRPAGYARGLVKITGLPGTKILKGTMMVTTATQESKSIEFITDETVTIQDNGAAEVGITAVEPGPEANVPAGTIRLLVKPIEGVVKITNELAVSGGTETEDDESLRSRIQETNASINNSFVGNDSDYIRWAKEVTGVGHVTVIPEWQGPGTVKLILIDANGEAANEQIRQAVYEHIVSPAERLKRLAPIGAEITTAAPELISVAYTGTVTLQSGYTRQMVEAEFAKEVQKYYETAKYEGKIKYNKLLAVLTKVAGIDDFDEFRVNGKMDNISLAIDEYPETKSIVLTISPGGGV